MASSTDDTMQNILSPKANSIKTDHVKLKGRTINLDKIKETWNKGENVYVTLEEDLDEKNKKEILPIIQSFSSKLQGKFDPKEQSEIYQNTIRNWPIFPCPIVASKLYLAFLDNNTSSFLVNSFDVLRLFISLERKMNKIISKKTADSAEDKKKQAWSIVLQRIYASYSDLFNIIPTELTEAYATENYFNTMNLLRIYEFTLLDYMTIPKNLQLEWITPEIFIVPENPIVRSIITDFLHQDILNCIKLRIKSQPSAEIQEKMNDLESNKIPNDIQGWTNSIIVWATLIYGKTMIMNRDWACSNYKHCNKQETKNIKFKKCSRCGWERYCSRECQIQNWKEDHKAKCKQIITKDHLKANRVIVGAEED